MGINKAMFTSNRKNWETPQSLFDKLDSVFHFDLDAAASDSNHKVATYYTAENDGLKHDWGGRKVFCNPPYGSKETGEWTKKCYEESLKENTSVVLLIPARTDRKSFHDYIYQKNNIEIDFLPGRLRFEIEGEPTDAAPFPSMLVYFNCNPEKVQQARTIIRG